MFRNLDIRNKLALVQWGAALLALAVVGGGLMLFDRLTLEGRASQAMEPYAQLVSVGAEAAVAFEDPVRAQAILDTLRANPQIVEAAILLEDGRILANYGHSPTAKPVDPQPVVNGIHLGDRTAQLVHGLQRGGKLSLTMDLDQFSSQRRMIYWMAGVAMIVLLVITLGQMAVLQRTIIRPIANLAEATEQVRSREDYSLNLSGTGTDEVARLGRSFETMMVAIRERESDLRRLTLFQRTLLDNAAYAIVSTTPAGVVSSFNPAAERLLGYAAVDMVGKGSLVQWPDPEEVRQRARQLSAELRQTIAPDFAAFTSLALSNQPDEHEWTFIRKDGTRVPVLLSVTAFRDEKGAVTGFVGIINDLTERKQMERQSLRAQRMEAVGTLASGVAHDLNNILSPILMGAEVLKDGLARREDLEVLTMIESSAQRGASIIRQLLLFGRGGEGSRAQVQPNHLLREMVKLMRETFPRNIEITDVLSNDLSMVWADATQLHQVFMNLCVNARDAMPKGGTLTLGARNVNLDEGDAKLDPNAKPGPYVVMTVADTGHGIAPEVLDRIFDPFYTTKALGKGSGLGLSTVLAIVHKHGGFVRVETGVGKGSVFSVYLPATAREMPILPQAPDAPARPGNGELILLVDDEAAIRAATGLLLEKNHYGVLSAANGQEAMDLYRQHRDEVRLVITDLMMPVMDGVELVCALRTVDAGVKVIAASGLGAEVDRAQLAALGVTEILAKPIEVETLLKAIRKQLSD
jgi:PAS domain S-box-containing protein